MKKIRPLLLLLAASSILLLTGCSTTTPGSGPPVPKITPERVQSISRLATYGSAVGFLIANPESRTDLERAKTVVATLVAGQQWDVIQLALALSDAGFEQLRSQEGILAVTGAIMLIDITAGKSVDIKDSVYAKAAILGALDGLNLALASRPAR